MKEIFKIYNSFTYYYSNDPKKILNKVMSFYGKKIKSEKDNDKIIFNYLKKGNKIDPLKTFQLIGLAYQKIKESEEIINTNKRKHFGIYYTDYFIARLIAKESLRDKEIKDLKNLTFYEPCSGSGIFIIAYIDEIIEKAQRCDQAYVQNIINNIYFSDIDEGAINILLKIIPEYINIKYNCTININTNNFFIGDALFNTINGKIEKTNPIKKFNMSKGFDIILTNPPYKLLKANGKQYENELLENKYAIDVKKIIHFIRKNNIYKYNQGTLNYYKIFLEEILENYSHSFSRIGVIIPITLLTDKQSELLRKRIINQYRLLKIYIIPEKNDFFPDISQAFCFFSLDKSSPGDMIRINPKVTSYKDFEKKEIEIDISHIEKISNSAPIVIEDNIGWKIIKKLNNFPKIKNLNSICNARGELDLTLDKSFITNRNTSLPIIRGNNISEFSYTLGDSFASEEFIRKTAKNKYITKERIVCQQISNIHLEKRLKFAKIPENVVLGNSCNFLTFDKTLWGDHGISLDYLLGILNSLLLNWRFKITNSNNHISNYELSELPIVIPSEKDRKNIEKIVESIKNDHKENILKLNMEVFKLYGLTKMEKNYIIKKHKKIITPLIELQLKNNMLHNHITYSLSENDLKMVKSIPQGGNWKHIPKSIPSKRLEKIRKTGGRTTLYGRLSWNKPSYTITTYFNRPGNGTYIHPEEDRVISAREAARLQSFPDNFIFEGSKTSFCKQIGNAVPPLLAYCIAKEIKKQKKINNVIDLFCGAGGLSMGFKWANFKIIAANDNFHPACLTYKKNHPETKLIEGDITQKNIKENLIKETKKQKIDIIIGGPPCQGFSYAGKRIIDDPRNFLYKEFIEIVQKINPEVVLMENVEGLLTSNNGKTFQSIKENFLQLGYKVAGKKLYSAQFGVPQRRKRVIIIATKKGDPEKCFPKEIICEENKYISVKMAIDNLPPIKSNKKISNIKINHNNFYQEFLSGKIDIIEYYKKLEKYIK